MIINWYMGKEKLEIIGSKVCIINILKMVFK